ncbi:mannose-6-phosphate isomerase, class I [Gracilibacillus caseinilyticus]|uniref:Mannose-6-phosphate isomerase n=1 Tax=Gracilibacillus caseinilyticus TaxID=2932256 RepID=A0ABY4EZ93_9BACI|nr:mannose-6-phosphate isomerase, class I [Gracilibacillus caseinilyticus]UOQ49605.1 mannose-6-phosphate isomerase, class I [Gracilibacillus caseinilyticus]
MYKEPIFLQAIFQERIWGGQKLHSEFHYTIPYEKTGEAWAISAHENGPSQIINGALKGQTLLQAWNENGELFNKSVDNSEAYPLLIKILDANDNLSVQVHPDDQYAREVANEAYGKTECWYVLSAEEGAELIIGHHAQTREELEQLIDQGKWDALLRRVPVKAGDFVYVPSGTIHAIGKGIVILETQQSSDITYRVYDYDRTDAAGNTRQLHLKEAKEVTTVPHETPSLNQMVVNKEGLKETQLVAEKYFTVYHWELDGEASLERETDFLQVSMVTGESTIATGDKVYTIKKGDHFIIPATVDTYQLKGNGEFIVSHPS